MPKVAKPLTALEVKRLTGSGRHMVGTVAGLGLVISDSGSRSWILRTKNGSKRSDIGLGSYPEVTLAIAHDRARQAKSDIRNGVDPIAQRKQRRSTIEWTFQRCAEEFIKVNKEEWTSDKHAQQWENTLKTYAYPKIGSKHVRDIGVPEVLTVIQPEWALKTETMRRVRQRIERVLAWAGASGYRDKENPATWRNNLDLILPKLSKLNKPNPHPALQTKDIQAFTQELISAEGEGAKCLLFAMLTACRSNEARGATWSEIDLDAAEWLIPKERMKSDDDHRIPLSAPAVALLKSHVKYEDTDLVFVGNNNNQLSDMTLSAVIKRMNKSKLVWADEKGKAIVPHGMRATFATWAQEHTNYPSELREHALAHKVGNGTTNSYERGKQFDKRRGMMENWAKFMYSKPKTNNVIHFKNVNRA